MRTKQKLKTKYKKYDRLISFLMPKLRLDAKLFITTKKRNVVQNPKKFFDKKRIKVGYGGKVVEEDSETVADIVINNTNVRLLPKGTTCREELAGSIQDTIIYFNKIFYGKDNPDINGKILFEPTKKVKTKDGTILKTLRGSIIIESMHNKELIKTLTNYKKLVPLLDLIVGNTCVLIDRDPYAKERKSHYYKAGNYEKLKMGIKYKTLSNFWIRDYVLVSFVMSLARLAVNLLHYSNGKVTRYIDGRNRKLKYIDFYKKLMSLVDMKDVKKAINNNDYELAKKNFLKIEKLLAKYSGFNDDFPFSEDTMDAFVYFVEKTKKNGLEYWFGKNPLANWDGNEISSGWESFLYEKLDNIEYENWERDESWKT